MQNKAIEKQITNFTLWFFALCALVILLTSCAPFDPYAALQVPTATAVIKVPTRNFEPPPHYWQLAALDAWHSIGTVSNSKVGH